MRIAQVRRRFKKACGRKYYGGTERVMSYLTEELVRQGHEVTLFASGRFGDECAAGGGVPEVVAFGQHVTRA